MKLKPFSELAHTDQIVRLDWFGGISPNFNEHDNPLIECFFTPIERKTNFDQSVDAYPQFSRNLKEQFRAGISVGFLPSLILGKLYKGGQALPISQWPAREFIELEIDTANRNTVTESFYDEIGFESNFKPVYDNFYTANFSGVKKLKGKLLNSNNKVTQEFLKKNKNVNLTVLLNEIELIRFYLTNSEFSCKQIFTGAYQAEEIARRVVNLNYMNRSGKSDGIEGHRLVYRHGYKESDAPMLARILFDESQCSLKAAQRVFKTISASRVNLMDTQLGYCRTDFPFQGTTRLQLSGRRVKTKSGWEFLANRIIGCTGPFPFEKLSFCDEIEQGGGPAPDDAEVAFENLHYSDRGPAHSKNNSQSGESRSNERPSATAESLNEVLGIRNFTGLLNVPLIREKLRNSTYRSQDKIARYQENLVNASTGKGTTGASSSAKQSITEDNLQPSLLTKDLETFIAAVRGLQDHQPNWKIQSIGINLEFEENVGGRKENFSCFPPVLCNVHAKYQQFSYLDKQQRQSRRLICMEIEIDGKYFYLFEAQRRKSEKTNRQKKANYENETRLPITAYKEDLPILTLHNAGYERQCKDNFLHILELTVTKKNWPNQSKLSSFVRSEIIHCSINQNVQDLTKKIENHLIGNLLSFALASL